MSQSTLGDDDLFGEAAEEMRDDVESALDAARAELPAADAVWETDGDNVLGVLNGLGAALDVGDAADALRQAKKWYAVGERADAFDDAEDLAAEIERVESVLELVETAGEQVNDLTSTLPELRGELQEFAAADAGGGAPSGGADDGGSESEAEDEIDGEGEAEAEAEAEAEE